MKYTIPIIIILTLTVSGCQKELSDSNAPADKYITLATNSTWTYQTTDNSTGTPMTTTTTITSTSRDTTINGKSYHIFNTSDGGSQYINITGHDYYEYDSLPIPNTAALERLYLKDEAVNTSWAQNVDVAVPNLPITIPLVVTNTITEKGISRTVNNINYPDVIHVKSTITSTLIPATSLTTNIDSYYAKKYGLIENTFLLMLNYLGITQNIDVKTILLNADLK